MFLRGGNGRIVSALARDVPVFYNHDVCSVSYPGEGGADDGGGVVVRCANGRSFRADVALVTVPLGVLKKEIIAFDPPLPERKLRAIANLGFGVLNKVILLFPEVFWDTTHDTFGYVRKCDGDSKKRGRYYMFYNYAGLSGGATLVALVAGDAALEMESGAFYTLVPMRPRRRGERRSLRTLPGASLRPGSLAHNPDTPRCLSTPSDAFELHPDVASYGTALSLRRGRGERRDGRLTRHLHGGAKRARPGPARRRVRALGRRPPRVRVVQQHQRRRDRGGLRPSRVDGGRSFIFRRRGDEQDAPGDDARRVSCPA